MSGLHHSIFKAFGISGIVKEKGYYKTTDDTKMIRKTKDRKTQIWAKYQIVEHCSRTGFPWMEKYYLSKEGQPYVFADGEHYIMTDLIKYREVDLSDIPEFLKTVESLAYWHKCARGIQFNDKASLHKGYSSTPLINIYETHGEALDIIRKRIRKQSKLSDFDVLFVKNYPSYRERIHKAQQLLESTNYLRRCHHARQKNHVCHGGLKEDFLRFHNNQVYITKLDQAVADYQLNDLCALIRRREKKYKDMERCQIINAYNKMTSFEPEEEIILEAMLLYPASFVKIVTEYYQKKRTWIPASMLNKMKEILANE